ncbi:MAG TPA: hypothetical protein VGO40_07755 [Longimicrobium sp.]|jgi:hypothetical protein|nr:hypothetical protein [Longimicrobium sp.]
MKNATWGTATAAAALLLVAGSAGAQVCAGFPAPEGRGTAGGLANFPRGYQQYGWEGSSNLQGPLALNGGILGAFNNGASLFTLRGGVAIKVDSIARLPGLSICPNLRVDFSSRSGYTLWQVPIGLGLGATLPLGRETALTPYVIPALVWQQLSAGTGNSVSESDFGVRGGANLGFGRFYLGGTVEWIQAPGTRAMFGVRGGAIF